VLLLPLLYPTGRPPSPRWRPLAWLAVLVWLLSMTSWAFRPGPLEASEVAVAPNPVGIPGANQLLEAADVIASTLSVPVFLAAVASVVVRFRRARGIERQQLKWFVYASLVVVVGFTLSSTLPTLVPGISELVLDLVVTGLSLAWPVALGIAILRYRLYDIDRLINRTLVYGLLTVLLGAVYVGLVLALGQVFGGIGSETPSWAVAGATLAVAALFQPARRRIQQVVDRRFNRRKYNAAMTVELFSARLREQVDLDTLSVELLAVVDQTMQPTAASLWLRPSAQTPTGGEGRGR
jgi:MFS family permease